MNGSTQQSARGLTLVSASAGSGKTHRLTEEVRRSLDSRGARPVAAESLVAVTYTTKAQAELESRLRQALIATGDLERAEALPLSYLGTVHSVCLRLLKEFAMEAGLSPAVDGLPQQAARHLLQEALELELRPEVRQALETVAFALELKGDHRTKRVDWITPVEQIMTLARNNRIHPDKLPAMARRSAEGLLALLPPPASDADALEKDLAAELATAIAQALQIANPRKVTLEAIDTMRDAEHRLREGCLPWSQWCKLSKLKTGKDAAQIVTGVQLAAAAYPAHPRFRQQIDELCDLIFEAARVGLSAYARWKGERGLVDYVDMIDHALSVLDAHEVTGELADRLELLVVDEFQDTTPVQLALFTRLHDLCKRSLWVGDRKQCIFEYAGADPDLMEAVARWVGTAGGSTDVLSTNYRSRPELVDATSVLFAAAFAMYGHDPDEVRVTPHRFALPELSSLPPFGLWWIQEKRGAELNAIASGVFRLLERPEATPVLDRRTGKVRPVRASDIAVLVATNREAEQLSQALDELGVKTVLPQTGLMATPEGRLLVCALAYLVDPKDTLAGAEIEALLGFNGKGPDAWLSERLRARATAEAPSTSASLRQLDELRAATAHLAPREMVDQLLALLDFPGLAMRWPDPAQRLANLDALRALAGAYEDRCLYLREAASLAGLIRYFEETQQQIQQQDEERASDEQHVRHSDSAVVLSTYHKSKGLEWPVVVLVSLERERKRSAFDVAPETDREEFDASDPLGSRWIRYWPWPLGQQREAPLRDRANASVVGQQVARREARERVRLLYVGFTRARDHLILALPKDAKGNPRLAWLDELRDETGSLLTLPDESAEQHVLGIRGSARPLIVPARVWTVTKGSPASTQATTACPRWFTRSKKPSPDIPYAVHPSSVRDACAGEDSLMLPKVRIATLKRFTQRIPFRAPSNASWDQIGTALHAFLAADRAKMPRDRRVRVGRMVLARHALNGAFDPESLVSASDALHEFVASRWPNAGWRREVPIRAVVETEHGPRCIQGVIDLLLETTQGAIVIDHKSFPGRSELWTEQALKHAPQLQLYALALRTAGFTVLGHWVHFTIGGGAVELVIDDGKVQ